MFLTRGGFHATVKLHDLETGESRIVNCEDECVGDHELSAYRSCIETYEVISMGKTIAEPVA